MWIQKSGLAGYTCGFDGARRGNYFWRELVSITEVETREWCEAAVKPETTGKKIKNGVSY